MAAKVGQVVVDFLLNTASFEKDIKKTSRKLRGIGKDLTNVGSSLTKGITLPLVAAGAALAKFTDDIDKGMASIRVGTGATGKALADLGTDMRAVLKQVPQNVGDVSTAIADLNTRLGLTGEPLRVMARQMLDLSRIAGTDVGTTIASATRLFGQFSVSTERQGAALDYVFKAAQSTGIGVDKLMTTATTYGAQLKSFGLDLEQSVALLAQWEKAGVNAEGALSGLSMGLGKFAKAGKAPSEGLRQLQAAMDAAKSETEAMNLAIDAFGTRSGAVLGQAMIEHRLNIDDLVESLKNSKETITDAAREAETFAEKWLRVKNNVVLALEPLGRRLLDAIDGLIPKIVAFAGKLEDLVEWFGTLPGWVQKTALGLLALSAAAGPVLLGLGSMVTALSSLVSLLPALVAGATAFSAALGGLPLIVGAIGVAAAAIYAAHRRQVDAIKGLQDGIKEAGEYEKELKRLGLEIDHTGMSTEEWVRQMRALKEEMEAVKKMTFAEDKLPGGPEFLRAAELKALENARKADLISEEYYQIQLKKIADKYAKKSTGGGAVVTKEIKYDFEPIDTIDKRIAEIAARFAELPLEIPTINLDDFIEPPSVWPADEIPEWLENLRDGFRRAQNPLSELVEEFVNLNQVGVTAEEILAANSKRIIEAAETQRALGGAIGETEAKWYDAARALENYGAIAGKSSKEIREMWVALNRDLLAEGKGGLGEIATVALGKFVEDFKNIKTSLADAFGDFFKSFGDGVARAVTDIENFGTAIKDVAKSAIGSLVSALARMGLQWIINATILKSVNKGVLAETAAQAAASATAWAPAAALASLATLGANAAPAAASIATVNALTQALARLGGTGFAEGGYTGDQDPRRIAGVVHGREFVVNAEATRDNLPLLKAINSGLKPLSLGSFPTSGSEKTARSSVNVKIENYGSYKAFEVQRIDEETVRIIARDEADGVLTRRGPDVIAGDLSNPNSRTSKAVSRYTTARRAR